MAAGLLAELLVLAHLCTRLCAGIQTIVSQPSHEADLSSRVQLASAMLLSPIFWSVQFLRADLGALLEKQRRNVGASGYFCFGSAVAISVWASLFFLNMFSVSISLIIFPFAAGILGVPALLYCADRLERRLVRRRHPTIAQASSPSDVAADGEGRTVARRLNSHTFVAGGISLSLILGFTTWFVRSLPALIPTFTYQGSGEVVRTLAWSPDGKHLASLDGSSDGGVKLGDLAHPEQPVTLSEQINALGALAWSADAAQLAVVTDRTIMLLDTQTGHVLWTTNLRDFGLEEALVGSSGAAHIGVAIDDLAQADSGNYQYYVEVSTIDAHTGAILSNASRPTPDIYAVAWCAGCARQSELAVGQEDDVVNVWTGQQLSQTFTWRGQFSGAGALAWSPDGQYIASGDGSGMVQGNSSGRVAEQA